MCVCAGCWGVCAVAQSHPQPMHSTASLIQTLPCTPTALQTVGVSNFNAQRVRNAAATLQQRGTVLSSNQVQYSLLYRRPDTNGVMEACREAGVTLVAYSPLCQGLLTGGWAVGWAGYRWQQRAA